MAHGHDHHHGNCNCDHSNVNQALAYSLYQKIDIENVKCYNESIPGSGKTIFKPWENRLDLTKFVDSDVDEELLFYIPFCGNIKLRGLLLLGGEEEQHPSELRLFKNRNPQGFDEIYGEPDQILQVSHDDTVSIEYAIKTSKFNSISSLVIHIPGNYGSDVTRLYYIGLKGDFTPAHKHEVTIATYEASPNPADHKIQNIQPVSNFVS